jgi:repressor LexA
LSSFISLFFSEFGDFPDNLFMGTPGEELVQRIGELIDQKGLKRTDLYKIVPSGTLSNWKHGQEPRSYTICDTAKFLGTTVEYLVMGKPPAGIPPETLDIARKIARLSFQDREEVLILINYKLSRYPGENPDKPLFTADPSPAYDEPKITDDVEYLDWEVVMLPYYGNVAAGEPLDINIPPGEYLPFPRQALKSPPEDYFYLRIRGYSMVEAGIDEGDLVVIRRAEEPESGKIMLVRYENAATLKRILRRGGKTYLQWQDGSGKEIEVKSKDYQVQGTVPPTLNLPK